MKGQETPRGAQLKIFLQACETQGILQLTATLLAEELESIWGGLHCTRLEPAHTLDVTSPNIEHKSLSSSNSCMDSSNACAGQSSDMFSHQAVTHRPDYYRQPSNSAYAELSRRPKISGVVEDGQDPPSTSGNVSLHIDVNGTPGVDLTIPSDLEDVSTPSFSIPPCAVATSTCKPVQLSPHTQQYSTPAVKGSWRDMSNTFTTLPNLVESNDVDDFKLPAIDLCNSSCEIPTCNSDMSFLSSAPAGRTCTTHVSLDSSNDDSDDKLEELFATMRIQSEKKALQKVSSRKSVSMFIVSDSEDLSDNEMSPVDASPLEVTCYHTPCTPDNGLIFWGSPDVSFPGGKWKRPVTSVKERAPFVERGNFVTPSVSPRKPLPVQPLTTPSAHKQYSRYKKDMLTELFRLFNKSVFDNKLLDVEIVWNNKLRTTAGYCRYRGLSSSRSSVIELSTKVCDSFDRLRDTLVHEMCHAACWVIDGVKNAAHGPLWRAWADKAQGAHSGLKPVTRCHDYEISYKYTYKCVRCSFKTGRHTKSVKLKTARCPYCDSELELEPRLKSDGTPFTARKLSKYAQFLKDHYNTVKESSPGLTHAQVLQRINRLYHKGREETCTEIRHSFDF